jgi:hypothetical protein
MLRLRPRVRRRLSRIGADLAAFRMSARLLIPLLRDPTAGLVAGDLVPIDRFQIAAAWAASAYPAAVWRGLSATERNAVIYRELRELDEAHAARRALE